MLLYADEGHQRCRRSGRLSFVHFKRRVRVARPESLQVGWDGAYFTGAIMPIPPTVDFCQLRNSSPVGMETIAGWKANGEVHNCPLGVETDELGFAGLSLRVTWPCIPGVDQGTSEAVDVSRYVRDVISRQSPCDNACLQILSNRLTVAQLDDQQST